MGYLADVVDSVLGRDIEYIDSIIAEKDSVREKAIKLSREIIRASAEATRMIHLNKYDVARENIVKAEEMTKELLKILKKHPDLLYSGLVYNCVSEYIEAYIVYNLIVEKKIVSYREINVPYIPYLQGLGDSIGELRRYIIDLLKDEKIEEAKQYLDVMETIYQNLRKLNYPDALMPGIRHKVDVARRLVEDTKVLFINTLYSTSLRKKLDSMLSILNNKKQ